MQAVARGSLLAVFAFALTGCAINPRVEIDRLASWPVDLDVPHYPQTENQCGPAALAGVLAAAGLVVDPDSLSTQIYIPERQGSLQAELLAATRRAGRLPVVTGTDPAALVGVLEGGRPVLVLLNLGTRSVPVWHYAVVVGLQPGENRIVLNSGATAGEKVPAGRFFRQWNWAGNWGFVVAEPGDVPRGVTYRRYAEAVAALEATAGFELGIPAWQAAIRHWPEEPGPYLALGNQAYSEGRPKAALAQWRAGLEIDKADPALVNNTASVLGELGCPARGLSYLHPLMGELPSGSPWRVVLMQTERELREGAAHSESPCAFEEL